jgi:hypothetical protein
MKLISRFTVSLASLLATSSAFASSVGGTAISANAFQTFAATVLAWLQGGLGIGIALIALIAGAVLGISNGTAFPMIIGLIIAAGFAFLPQVLDDLVVGAQAALLPMAVPLGG